MNQGKVSLANPEIERVHMAAGTARLEEYATQAI